MTDERKLVVVVRCPYPRSPACQRVETIETLRVSQVGERIAALLQVATGRCTGCGQGMAREVKVEGGPPRPPTGTGVGWKRVRRRYKPGTTRGQSE